jgi:hypothetical protein
MFNVRSFVVCAAAFAGVLIPLGSAQAFCVIRGNLFYKDGFTAIKSPGNNDTVTVRVFRKDGTEITRLGTITMPTMASYQIKIDPTIDLVGYPDRVLTIKYYLNANMTPDRVVEGVNGNSLRTLTIDIGVSKTATVPGTPPAQNGIITGKWVYNDNVTGMLAKSTPAIQVFFNNGDGTTQLDASKITPPPFGGLPNYTITIAPSDIPAGATDKTLTIVFLVNNGGTDRTLVGVLANDSRVQTIDISSTFSVPALMVQQLERHPEMCPTASCCNEPRCGTRCRGGILRGRRCCR